MRPLAIPLLGLLLFCACESGPDLTPPPTPPAAPLAPAETMHQPGGALIHDDPDHGLAAFQHRFGDDDVVIVTNWSDEAHSLRIEPSHAGQYQLQGATTTEPYRVQSDATGIILEIGARTTLILERQSGAD